MNMLMGGGVGKGGCFNDRKLVSDSNTTIGFMSNGFDYELVLSEFIRICKIPNMFIFCSNDQVTKIINYFNNEGITTTILVWHKTNPIPLCNGKHLSDLEFIVYAHAKGSTFNNDTPTSYKSKVFTSGVVSSKNRFHMAQKPIELIERFVLLCSNENDTILDSFMGSGTTGIASIKHNRNFIGIEIDESYFKIAKDRIESESKKPKQFKLF